MVICITLSTEIVYFAGYIKHNFKCVIRHYTSIKILSLYHKAYPLTVSTDM